MKGLFGGLLFVWMVPGICTGQSQGTIENASCTTISGWAALGGAGLVTVAFTSDGVQFGSAQANLYRSDA